MSRHKCCFKYSQNEHGYGLLECLLVMAMLAVMCMTGRFAARETTAVVSLHHAERLLFQIVIQARLTAIHQKATRCLCMFDTHYQCDFLWQTGQLTVIDSAFNPLRTIAWPGGVKIHWRGNLGHNSALCFTKWGATSGQMGHFLLSRGEKMFKIGIDFQGHAFRQLG